MSSVVSEQKKHCFSALEYREAETGPGRMMRKGSEYSSKSAFFPKTSTSEFHWKSLWQGFWEQMTAVSAFSQALKLFF